MSDEKWFLGRVSRQKAEELLNISGVTGSFVIRSSESIPGAYALSVLHNKTVHTYRVLPTENGLLAVQTLKGVQHRKFATLADLVREYRNPQNGLICALTNPVGLDTSASPKIQTFESPFLPSRTDALPPTPTVPPLAAATPATRSHINLGVKLIPHINQQDTTLNLSIEKPKESRDLPPVPTREPFQRPVSKLQPNNLDTISKEVEIKSKFMSRLNEIKMSWPSMNNNFLDIVQQYMTDGGLESDLSSVGRGGLQCAELQTLLAREAVGFQTELENFLMKIDVLRQLFDLSSPPRKSHSYNRTQDTDVDLDTFLGRLGDCQTVVKSLNKRACINLQDVLGLTATMAKTGARKTSRTIEPITERTFEVKQDGAIILTKQKLKVDIMKGKLSVIKTDGTTEYDHAQVLQLIKSNKSKTKLSVVFEGNKKRDYTFEQSSHREAFCQLMQHIRNKMSTSAEPDCVSVFCGSWNMGDAIPPSDISSWFLCSGSGRCLDKSVQAIPHDIYVVGTQETGLPEKDWLHKVTETLQDLTGSNFHVVAMDALWHIKIIILVKEEHKNRISHVQTSSVKTGIANALGNKGAVAVSFQFGGTSFCFINAHLTSGAEKCGRRNQNYHDIIRSLNLGEDRFRIFDLTNRFDHLYFFGDLNYRLEMDVQEILQHIKKKELAILNKVDQLRREKDSNKVFSRFDEEEILFPPTYRYERGSRDTYSHLKVKKTGIRINVPSWCDRVLWKSYPETHSVCLAYGCSDDVTTSDHSPLFSNFQVGVGGQYVSSEEISSSSNTLPQSFVNFDFVEVLLKAPGKSGFYLQFHSVCLPKSVNSSRNSKLDTADINSNFVRISWNSDCLPQLEPIISDRKYLVDQHILVSVRADDDNEVHGECVIALRSMIGSSSQKFEEKLSRRGDDTGQIRGQMLVKARDSFAPKVKTYEFIRRDDEDMKRGLQIQDVATYSDINDVNLPTHSSPKHQVRPRAQSPSRMMTPSIETQKNTFIPDVAVYAGDRFEEGEYADPDEVKTSIPSNMTASSVGLGGMSYMSGSRGSPPDHPAPKLSMDIDKAVKSANRPLPNPRGSNVSTLPGSATPPSYRGQVLSPSFMLNQPLSKPTRPYSAVLQVDDDALAEFAEAEKLFKSSTPPNTPSTYPSKTVGSPTFSVTPFTSLALKESLYDTPASSMRVKGSAGGKTGTRLAPTTTHNFQSTSAAKRRSHEGRGTPSTVEEFLGMINLLQYSTTLQENGWDSIEFLSDITEADLNDSGIMNPLHCRLILERIQALAL